MHLNYSSQTQSYLGTSDLQHSAQRTGEKWGEKLIPAPVSTLGLAGSRGKMLTEAWKPPKPEGRPVGADLGR